MQMSNNFKPISLAMSKYLLLNQAFCDAHQNYSNETGKFGYGITIQGDYVTAEQTLIDFPELFENDTYLFGLPIIELTTDDFPKPVI